jgi:hypothetical protein
MINSKIKEVEMLATKLEAIADWQRDSAQGETATSKALRESSKWLKKLSHDMCGQGFIGCEGGEDCDSDHK